MEIIKYPLELYVGILLESMYLVTFHQWYHVEKAAGELQPNYTEFTNNRSISPFTDLILKFTFSKLWPPLHQFEPQRDTVGKFTSNLWLCVLFGFFMKNCELEIYTILEIRPKSNSDTDPLLTNIILSSLFIGGVVHPKLCS